MMFNRLLLCLSALVLSFPIESTTAQRIDLPRGAPPNRPTVDSLRQPTNAYSLINDLGDSASRKRSFDRVTFDADTKFVSPASRIVALHAPEVQSRTGIAMASAAKKFLTSLPEELASKAVHKLDSRERSRWTNLPARPDAGGVSLGALDEQQIETALDLLATMLSDEGYEKLRLIMLGDDELIRGRRRGGGIGSEAFSLVIFGEPDPEKLWAIQFDGHHIGLNLAVKGNNMTLGPSFIGAQPFEFKLGKQTLMPMLGERDIAFKIAQNLTEEQFRSALKRDRRGNLVAGPGQDGNVPKPQGISCRELTDAQKAWMIELVSTWVTWLPSDRAQRRLEELRSEIDEMKFSWSGPRESGSDVSYIIQGPSLLIEFAYQDLGGTPQQHLHTQYRNLKNEYGSQFK